jgi:hypothetical protein
LKLYFSTSLHFFLSSEACVTVPSTAEIYHVGFAYQVSELIVLFPCTDAFFGINSLILFNRDANLLFPLQVKVLHGSISS